MAVNHPSGLLSTRLYSRWILKPMKTDKIDDAVLALLYLGHWLEGPDKVGRSWKSFDWDTMARLHEKGMISDPVSKAKSVTLSDNGLREAQAAFEKLFGPDTANED